MSLPGMPERSDQGRCHPEPHLLLSTLPSLSKYTSIFPCQPFSLAGVSKKASLGREHGFGETRSGNLFFEIVRILKAKAPTVVLLENVKNLVGHDRGRTMEVILRELDAAGYEDPRAKEYLLKTLMERRDKVLRYYFRETAPLDFFEVKDGRLAFHDLAKDVGITGPREYVVHIDSEGKGSEVDRVVRLKSAEIPLDTIAPNATHLELHLSIAGSKAKSVKIELSRTAGADWVVTWIRHG